MKIHCYHDKKNTKNANYRTKNECFSDRQTFIYYLPHIYQKDFIDRVRFSFKYSYSLTRDACICINCVSMFCVLKFRYCIQFKSYIFYNNLEQLQFSLCIFVFLQYDNLIIEIVL